MKVRGIKTVHARMLVMVHLLLLLLLGFATPGFAADDVSVAEQAKEVINESAEATAQGWENLQEKISESRLANRTRHQNVALVLMGILVGSFAGMFSKIGHSGMGIAGRLALGLAGAFIGGLIVRAAEIDFEWGVVSMTYEELLFSFLGAFALVGILRLVRYQMSKKKKSKK